MNDGVFPMFPGDEEDVPEDAERGDLQPEARIWQQQVAPDFDVPEPPRTEQFYLEPLGEQHNQSDYAAWTSSIEHIRATPGFPGRDWPCEMGLADNLEDLRKHAEDFRLRRDFTYTVLDPADGEVIGCVYIYPPRDMAPDVRSWVRADRAELDVPLWRVVSAWLDTEWPFVAVAYADR